VHTLNLVWVSLILSELLWVNLRLTRCTPCVDMYTLHTSISREMIETQQTSSRTHTVNISNNNTYESK
jgi:hypothetical protein